MERLAPLYIKIMHGHVQVVAQTTNTLQNVNKTLF